MTLVRFVVVAVVTLLLSTPLQARADVVLHWNAVAVAALIAQGQSPFAQARYMSIIQLAVFEAVNTIDRQYEAYPGPVVSNVPGAAIDAAAITAAYTVLKTYSLANATVETEYAASMAALPEVGKAAGEEVGKAAAKKMTDLRVGDGVAPAETYLPSDEEPAGRWELTPNCTAGINFQWQKIKPFGVANPLGGQAWIDQFLPGPPPAITSNLYAKDYNEVKRVGSGVAHSNPERPADREDVARFFAPSSPSYVFNLAARQIAVAQGRSIGENARALALISMASNDALVVSFAAKYHYMLWRPVTAIRADSDDNRKTETDPGFTPFITTPCFPSYPSNHGSGSNSAAEILRRVYGAGGHDITITNPAVPGVTLLYDEIKQITDDIADARVYGGIHFRFDQDAGGRLGRAVAAHIYKNNLRPIE